MELSCKQEHPRFRVQAIRVAYMPDEVLEIIEPMKKAEATKDIALYDDCIGVSDHFIFKLYPTLLFPNQVWRKLERKKS